MTEPIRSKLRSPGSKLCYQCSHEYDVLGDDPATCPRCGSRAVPLIDPISVTEIGVTESEREDAGDVLEVILEDATDRWVAFYVDTKSEPPRIRRARYHDSGFAPDDDNWGKQLVPVIVYEAVEQELGRRPTLAETVEW